MGRMTYFYSTQFAVYNGMNHGCKNTTVGIIRVTVRTMSGGHEFHFSSSRNHQ